MPDKSLDKVDVLTRIAPHDHDTGRIVVIEKRTGVAWIVSGVVVSLMMILSFASWLIGESIRYASEQADRAQALSLMAMEMAGERHASSVEPGYLAVWALIMIAVIFILRGLR